MSRNILSFLIDCYTRHLLGWLSVNIISMYQYNQCDIVLQYLVGEAQKNYFQENLNI